MTHSSPENVDTIPLADHDEIGRKVLTQPWDIQKAIVTITAHCTALVDEHPTGPVADLAGCISQGCLELADALNLIRAQQMPTPAAKWREQGKPDPHLTRYDCEREHLPHGDMTDDEIANAVFLNNHDIDVLTAAKDRIRWLSRQLTEAKRLLSMSALTSPGCKS